jgi:hypothetical protein
MPVTGSQMLFTVFACFHITAVNLHEGQNKRGGAVYVVCATYQNIYLINLTYVNEILHLFCRHASQMMTHFQELAKSIEQILAL